MIHGYADFVSQQDLRESKVQIDTDVQNPDGTWTSKQLSQWEFVDFIQKATSGFAANFSCVVNQTANAANTEYAIPIQSQEYNNGFGITNDGNGQPTLINVGVGGTYKVSVGLEITRTSGGNSQHIDTWFKVNGNPISNSNAHMVVQANSGHVVLPNENILFLNQGDKLQVMWAVSDVGIRLQYDGVTGLHPANPAARITINRVF